MPGSHRRIAIAALVEVGVQCVPLRFPVVPSEMVSSVPGRPQKTGAFTELVPERTQMKAEAYAIGLPAAPTGLIL
jgi:hypothetical protein